MLKSTNRWVREERCQIEPHVPIWPAPPAPSAPKRSINVSTSKSQSSGSEIVTQRSTMVVQHRVHQCGRGADGFLRTLTKMLPPTAPVVHLTKIGPSPVRNSWIIDDVIALRFSSISLVIAGGMHMYT